MLADSTSTSSAFARAARSQGQGAQLKSSFEPLASLLNIRFQSAAQKSQAKSLQGPVIGRQNHLRGPKQAELFVRPVQRQ